MSETKSKAQILKNIRQALVTPVSIPYPELEGNTENVYAIPEEDMAILFAQQFKAIGGKFSWCENFEELENELAALIRMQGWKEVICWEDPLFSKLIFENTPAISKNEEVEHADASITYCECLIARTGSALLTSKQAAGRQLGVYAPVHIIVASVSQIVADIKDGLEKIQATYGSALPSMICLTTGPSRTADIEKTLVVGVHGPKEIYVFLVNEKTI